LKPTLIRDCYLFDSAILEDNRGFFTKPISDEVVLDGMNELFWSSSKRNVARGLHLQLPPFAASKIVLCVSGTINDYVLDLRCDSQTYKEHISVQLGTKKDNFRGVLVPPGCAHGFVTLSDTALVVYLQSQRHHQSFDTGVHLRTVLSDEEISPLIISERDAGLPVLATFENIPKAKWLNV
jgi:dTDP-4-dehydrorhamnose 3,5-epimerase